MENFLIVTAMAVLQGVTEFLPVSSSGHLELLSHVFKLPRSGSMALSIMLHAGSLAAIIVFYFKTLWSLLKRENRRVIALIIIGSIPAGAAGVTLKLTGMDAILTNSLSTVAFGFLITGTLLRLTEKRKLIQLESGEAPRELHEISVKQSLVIGILQAIAIMPGISRSGSTIACGILSGVKREAAAAFSFLLALPAIGGAALLELRSLLKGGNPAAEIFAPWQLVWGVVVSAAFSLTALALLMNFVRRGKLVWFAWYLYAVGGAILLTSAVQSFKIS